MYTLCCRKLILQADIDNFVNSQRIFKILLLIERPLSTVSERSEMKQNLVD